MMITLITVSQHRCLEFLYVPKCKAYIPLQRKITGVGASRWVSPPMRRFCGTYTNMLVSENAKICVTPNANSKICVTPNAKPQRQSVEYRLRWLPNAKFSCWPCRFHVVYPVFFHVGYPTGTLSSVEYGLFSCIYTVVVWQSGKFTGKAKSRKVKYMRFVFALHINYGYKENTRLLIVRGKK